MKIEDLINEYQSLDLSKSIHFDKFNLYFITHHSTSLEGSTLTEIETNLLLDEGLTPKGKPLEHSLMTTDHAEALLYIINEAKQKKEISNSFIQKINAKVMAKTGKIYNTVLGEVDATSGAFRKGNVSAGIRYFPNYDKVESLTEKLCNTINKKLKTSATVTDQLYLSFDAHFDLVSIHPFYDGNGRTSRLLMNYILSFFQLPLAIVFKEDKAEYIEALEKSRTTEDLTPFRNFMLLQYSKFLTREILNFKSIDKKDKGKGFSMIF
jgi:Fic family protein